MTRADAYPRDPARQPCPAALTSVAVIGFFARNPGRETAWARFWPGSLAAGLGRDW